MGRAVFSPNQADLVVEGEVSLRPLGGFRARVSLRRPGGEELGERLLESEEATCARLDEGVAIALALMLDLELEAGRQGAPRRDPGEIVTLPSPSPSAERERERAPSTRADPSSTPSPQGPPVEIDARFGGALVLGLASSSSAALHAGLSLSAPRSWALRFDGWVLFPAEESSTAGGAHLGAGYASVSACVPLISPRPVALSACAGAAIGLIHAEPYGYEGAPAATFDLFLAPLIAAHARWTMSPSLGLELGSGVWVPVARPTYEFRTASSTTEVLFTPWALTPFVSLAIVLGPL